ncbi:hypothetical protein GCM10009754_53170 [Amycolatopsis minnesotensis]|uniref:Uncharacterized protein n=1 Tax=Amycolatopsis minnesotensis TaxID=337894 RepID=A0ABP5D097_9PSEU
MTWHSADKSASARRYLRIPTQVKRGISDPLRPFAGPVVPCLFRAATRVAVIGRDVTELTFGTSSPIPVPADRRLAIVPAC